MTIAIRLTLVLLSAAFAASPAEAQSPGFLGLTYGPDIAANQLPLNRTTVRPLDVIRVNVLSDGGGNGIGACWPCPPAPPRAS